MSADFTWLRCTRPDDVLVAKRHLGDTLGNIHSSPCGHAHLIILTDDLDDLRFISREMLKTDGATT